jgi:hypothetical protein
MNFGLRRHTTGAKLLPQGKINLLGLGLQSKWPSEWPTDFRYHQSCSNLATVLPIA